MRGSEWPELFRAAFTQSRNAMVLVDERRSVVDVNGAFLQVSGYKRAAVVGRPTHEFVSGGPTFNNREWAAGLAKKQFTGEVSIICANGEILVNQWGAHSAGHTGHRLVLVVMLSRSRWGARFRRELPPDQELGDLSAREREIVHLVALGRSGPEIAEDLGIAHDTVRTHVRNAMHKTGTRSRAQLVAKALGEGQAHPALT
jgi:PAS domain S-box-containing protein